ncbi:SRPBCC family protein [Epibacterium sp. SM1979]|uniref:SRPBCC family protein n=1 Tax=Tritonibacter litoralis TaxID=2662264 RepID=A0A843YFP5_9RHOB|nr:SRPBCC family protein [Tritonibacter litoralis]MQQ08102.1 SRPBCC family protein [Tritonibacter litoralis]
MKTFDVQSIGIEKPAAAVYEFIARPQNLTQWTNAFERADETSADLVTPAGAVPIQLKTVANAEAGSVDWHMTFPDGSVGTAFSRVTPDGAEKSIYTFVLMAPPVPLEALEGALQEQMGILAKELVDLKTQLEA